MKCEYCARRDTDDGHGNCLSCGAPVRYDFTSLPAPLNYGCTVTAICAAGWDAPLPVHKEYVTNTTKRKRNDCPS